MPTPSTLKMPGHPSVDKLTGWPKTTNTAYGVRTAGLHLQSSTEKPNARHMLPGTQKAKTLNVKNTLSIRPSETLVNSKVVYDDGNG